MDNLSWVVNECIGELGKSVAPCDLLERLFADPRCPAFGADHHFIVGACLLTALASAKGDSGETLLSRLSELGVRSSSVPGAACARWGVCGAGVSAGMAYAIASGNEPLKENGWAEGQKMVALIGLAIADAGAPRCCKRDSRIAVEVAAGIFERDFCVSFPSPEPRKARCAFSEANTVCLRENCSYYENR